MVDFGGYMSFEEMLKALEPATDLGEQIMSIDITKLIQSTTSLAMLAWGIGVIGIITYAIIKIRRK